MILITGASGFVGRALAARLTQAGEQTRCLVRTIDTARKILPATAELVQGNTLHANTLGAAFAGVDTVVHSAFMTAERKQSGEETYYNVNVSGTNNVIDAAKRAGVKRIIVVSGLGTKADKPGTYMHGRFMAEEAVKQSGLGWSILQPSVQFGTGSAFFIGLANLIKAVPVVTPVAGTGKEPFQFIWVEDVVTCLVKQIHEPARNSHTYVVGGSEVITYNQVLDMIMDTINVHKIKVPGPGPFVKLGAALMEAVLPKPPITVAALELFKFPNIADSLDVTAREFGFQPKKLGDYLKEFGIN